jgi:hypothetical protein
MLKSSFHVSGNSTRTEHVGLPHKDIDLNGPAHIRGLVVGIGQRLVHIRSDGQQSEHRNRHRNKKEASPVSQAAHDDLLDLRFSRKF